MSKGFVEYHCCGACYADGTLLIISKNGGCYNPKSYPFGKHPADVRDKFNTRLQLKQKRHIITSYIASYYTLLFNRMKNYSTDQEINALREQKIKFFKKPMPEPEDVKPNNNDVVNVNDDMLKTNTGSSNEDKMKLEILTL